MKIYRMLLLGLSFPVFLFAAGPAPQPITIDSQSRVVAGQEVYRASARTFRLSFVDNGTATDITGYTPFMTWSTSNTASICYTSVASVVSATGGVADCAFSSAQLDYAAGTYIFEAGLVDDPIVFRQGVFRIRASPYGQGTGAAIATTNLNWAAIGNTGTESAPFALKTRTITIDGVSGLLTNNLTFSTAGSTNTPAVYLSVTNIADSAPHLTLTRTDAHTITVTETGFGTAADSNASAFVAAGDVALAAALTNITGGTEIVVAGSGRTRMLSIAAAIARDAEVIAATSALDVVAFDGEVDPAFTSSVAASITAAATQEWSTAYGWGNHAMTGYAGTDDLADVVADVDVLQTGKAVVVHAHVWTDLTDGGTVSQNMATAADAAAAARDTALSNAVVVILGGATNDA
ncbi:MAG: hypothetical protein PHH26_01710, partial [Candidatus Thermoplasmatota archaeon]|nr:hypothetical protein [Candidatus Thermoplasmatota archaeon]